MWCSASAVNGLINRGMPVDWSTHYIGNILTILYNITHASALALVLEQLLFYKIDKKKEKLNQLGVRVFNFSGNKVSVAKKTIEKIINFLKKMNLKTKLKDYNLCAKKVSKDVINYIKNEDFEKIGEHRDIDLIDIKKILERC